MWVPSVGRGRLPGSLRAQMGGHEVWTLWQSSSPSQTFPFLVGSSPSATGKPLPVPCKPIGLHHGLTARQGQEPHCAPVSPSLKWGKSSAARGQRALSLSLLQCPERDPCQALFVDRAGISDEDTLASQPAACLQPLPQGHPEKHQLWRSCWPQPPLLGRENPPFPSMSGHRPFP